MTMRLGVTTDADLAPLFYPLEAGWSLLPSEITSDTRNLPGLEKGLLDDTLDVAPVSPVFYAQHRKQLRLLPFPVRATDIATDSVFLVSGKRLDMLEKPKVAVSPSSQTAEVILKIIASKYYGFEPEFRAMLTEASALEALNGQADLSLLSGEAAMRAVGWAKAKGMFVEDLTKAWWILTGLPLPTYLFCARKKWTETEPNAVQLTRNLMLYFRSALRTGFQQTETMFARISARTGLPEDVLEAHYRVQRHELNEGHLRGLLEFYRRAAAGQFLPLVDDLEFFPNLSALAPTPQEPPRRNQPEQPRRAQPQPERAGEDDAPEDSEEGAPAGRPNRAARKKASRRSEAEALGLRVLKGGKDKKGGQAQTEIAEEAEAGEDD